MPRYKLTYFPSRGRAEPIRLLFVDAGAEFEDCRITDEDWSALKASGHFHTMILRDRDGFPLNQVPVLEIDDKLMPQSRAIFRHLSRKYGYNGSSEEEAVKIDIICETIEDLYRPAVDLVFGPGDEGHKAHMKELYKTTTMPTHLKYLEKILSDQPEGNGYFISKDISMADLVFFAFIESVDNMFPCILANYPKLQANRDLIRSREKIAAYLAKHTPTYM